MKFLAVLVLGVVGSVSVMASDHIDGPLTSAHRVADLSDLYAYPTPKKPGFITIILNTYPIVPASGHFTDKAVFNLILRKASISGGGDSSFFQTAEEVVIRCSFKAPKETHDHEVMCKSSNGLSAENKYEKVAAAGEEGDFRLYSGMRSDPFFFNSKWATAASTKGKILAPKDDNVMADVNMLTIVMEIEANKLIKGASLFAIASEVITQDSPNSPIRRLDRLGRPEVTNVSLVAQKKETDLRDQYNLDRPFQVPSANLATYQAKLAKNISYYDGLDGKKNWSQDREREHLAAILANDFLVVDISKPCEGDDFFEIEKSILANKAHSTCGGRKPADDIMDTLFTLYIAGMDGKRIRDGVDKPYKQVSPEFPYLQAPELGLAARSKAFIARKLLGLSK